MLGLHFFARLFPAVGTKAVKNYLIKKGISDQRLIAVGFGKSRPKTTNRTEEGRTLNRRVELLPVQ